VARVKGFPARKKARDECQIRSSLMEKKEGEDFVRYVWSGDTKHYFQHSERQLQDLEKLSEIKIISISNYILDICLKDIFSEFLREFILSTGI